jgi:hypothetical protein
VTVGPNQNYGIDLDHDGTADIYLGRKPDYNFSFVWASADPNLGNGVAETRTQSAWHWPYVPVQKSAQQGSFMGTASTLSWNRVLLGNLVPMERTMGKWG